MSATRVDRTVFERTDFGSLGWIAKVPEALLPIGVMVVGSHQLGASFRSREPKPQLNLWNQTWQRLDWIAKVPEGVLEVYHFFPPWHSQAMSFRNPERSGSLDLFTQTWQRLDWIAKVPEALTEPGPITDFRIARHRFNLNLTNQHIALKYQHDTLDETLMLQDVGLGIGAFPGVWGANSHNLNLTSNHITLKFQHDTLDEILYLEDVGFEIFTHGQR